MSRFFTILILTCIGYAAAAAEVIPPAPKLYFNDYAEVVSSETADRLNETLANFERSTSSQIVVAIFSTMQSDTSIDDYTFRVARAWQVGQKGKNNGAVLFVFVQDHKMYLQVGYGLEGALPDSLCKRIIDQEIAPRFKKQDFEGGLSAGVTAIIAATRGEYIGKGRTTSEIIKYRLGIAALVGMGLFALFLLVLFIRYLNRASCFHYARSPGGWYISSGSGGGFWNSGGGSYDSSTSFDSGSYSSSDFSSGGGDFGGGGAGGDW